MEKIRLLAVSATYEIGGSDINLLRLLKSLDNNAYSKTVLLPYDGPLVEEFRKNGIKVRIMDMPRIRIFKNPLKYLGIIIMFFPTVFKIKKMIIEEEIDLVATFSMVNPYAALAAKLAHRPHILKTGEYLFILKFAAIYFYFLSDRIICVSRLVRGMFPGNKKVLIIRNSINTDEFSPDIRPALKDEISGGKKIVSMVTRLAQWKGVETFIRSSLYVREDIKFIIFGQAILGKEEYCQYLKILIRRLGVEKKVVLKIGEYRYTDTPALIACSDIIVHASLRPEPFGLVIIEAMATGKPVIASRLGGPQEIITDGKDGILIKPGRPDILASAISSILNNPSKAIEMGQEARRRVVDSFNFNDYASNVDKVFKSTYSLKQRK